MGLFSVCDRPFDSAGSCVGNVDNVLHNFESVPCLTPVVQQAPQNRNVKLLQSCRWTHLNVQFLFVDFHASLMKVVRSLAVSFLNLTIVVSELKALPVLFML